MDCLTLKMKALRSFGMSVSRYMYQPARRNIPEDLNMALDYNLELGYKPLETTSEVATHVLENTLSAPSVQCHLLSHVTRFP
jgi:hypothetical protein